MSLYLGIGWLGWLLIMLAAVGVVALRDREGESGNQVGGGRLHSASWGVLFAGVGYAAFNHYSAADVTSFLEYAIGPGRVWIGLGVLAFAGYVWQEAAGDATSGSDMIENLRRGVSRPMQRIGGLVVSIILTVAFAVVTAAMVVGDVLGLGLGLFAAEPGFSAAALITVTGWITLGGSVPIIDPYLPEALRGLGTVFWLGICLSLIAIGLAFRSDNFGEGVNA